MQALLVILATITIMVIGGVIASKADNPRHIQFTFGIGLVFLGATFGFTMLTIVMLDDPIMDASTAYSALAKKVMI